MTDNKGDRIDELELNDTDTPQSQLDLEYIQSLIDGKNRPKRHVVSVQKKCAKLSRFVPTLLGVTVCAIVTLLPVHMLNLNMYACMLVRVVAFAIIFGLIMMLYHHQPSTPILGVEYQGLALEHRVAEECT